MTDRRENGTGTVLAYRDGRGRQRYKVGILLADGRRKWKTLKPGTSEAMADERARAWTEQAKADGLRLRSDPRHAGETVAEWFKRLAAEREARGLTSVRDDRGRFEKWIEPSLGAKPIRAVERDDVRALVRLLDEKVLAGELAWKTAAHVWTLLRVIFGEACSSKRPDLLVRDDDPTDRLKPPDRGEDLARAYLYPSEFRALVTCKEVPLAWRRLYVLAAYTLSRAGELAALRWDAVDLERGVIHFRQATDRRRAGSVKAPKTGRTRRIPIELALRPLLQIMQREASSDRVIHVPVSKRAERLREHLLAAGLTRAELHPPPKDDPSVARTWAPLTFHDLRGTGVTWMALRGDEPLVIQQRAGHEDFTTTQRYLREAETLGQDAGEPFPALPADLLEERSTDPGMIREASTSRNPGAGHGVRTRSGGDRSAPSPEKGLPSTAARPASASDNYATAGPGISDGSDPIEVALAAALERASAAGEWTTVTALARELEARRAARSANVVDLAARRRGSR